MILMCGLGEQEFYVVGGEFFDVGVVVIEDCADEGIFAFLELHDFFFDGIAGNEPIGEDGFVLANAMGSIDVW